MRIITGKYKGFRIKKAIPNGIRPSTDFFRQSLFNILNQHITFEDIRVLDLFAGAGLFGFECLSRGASFVHFVDSNATAIEIIKSTATELNINKSQFKATRASVPNFLSKVSPTHPFQLIFSDPPYELLFNSRLLFNKNIYKFIEQGTLFAFKQSAKEQILLPNGFEKIFEKDYSETSLIIVAFNNIGE